MSVDRKEIDLIIRAALQGGKTLDGVSKSIGDIEKALVAQAEAAKRGESSIDELKSTLLALQRVQDQLKDQAGLIGQYDRLAKQIEKTSLKVTESGTTFAEYGAKIEKAGKATDFQREKLIKLGAASERNQVVLAKQRADHEALATALHDAGISVDDLAAAETRARQSAAQLGITINATQQAIASYAEDVRNARDREREWKDTQAFEKKRQDALNLFKAAEYVNLFTDVLDKADLAEQQLQINSALRKTADEAIAAARGYKTLGEASKSLTGTQNSLRTLVNGIVNPAEQARTTLAGVEAQIQEVAAAANSSSGAITNYREQVNKLAAAQKELTAKASLVDQFAKQVSSLRDARSAFVNARSQVLHYAEALRNSSGENDALQASLRASQVALAQAQRTLAAQLATTRGLRDAMRDAGLSTNDLAATQARLAAAARQSVSAVEALDAAKKKYGSTVAQVKTQQDLFTDSGRTTLSLMQRFRGEVLSLVAAYVGLYGAVEGAKSSIDAFNAKQAIRNQLALTSGNDSAKVAAEYDYIRKQADRLGLSFESAAKGYAKFSASATLAGRDSQEIRYIFESFSEVGRVAGLTADNMDGVFKALEQVMSKGSIQAEELRGQLGDRLFGAFQVAADALKKEFPNLDKAMKEGKVTSDQLIKIAEKYKEIVGGQLGTAVNSLAANQERLNNQIFFFKTMVAEQGFADEYAKLVSALTDFFRSDDGKQFAKDIADAFGVVAKGMTWVVENAQRVKEVVLVAFGLVVTKAIISMGIALAALPARFVAVEVSALAAGTAILTLTRVFTGFAAAIVGYEIGSILRENITAVRQWAVGIVFLFETVRVGAKYSVKALWSEVGNLYLDGMSAIGNWLTKWARDILGIFSSTTRAIGNGSLADSIDKVAEAITFKTDRARQSAAALRKEMYADLKQIRKISQDMMADATNPPVAGVRTPEGVATDKPSEVTPGKTGEDEAAAAKRVKIKEQIENELTAIEARIERNEKESLSRRLAAIDLTYTKLLNKIKKLGGADGAEFSSRLTASVNELKLQETRKFNDKLVSEQEAITRKLEQVDAAAGKKDKGELQNRLDAVKVQYESTYREIADLRATLLANNLSTDSADASKTRLDMGVAALQTLEQQKFYEDAINLILEERKAKLDTIAVQEKVGLITATQAREMSAKVVNDTQPKMEAITAEALKYVDAMILAAEASGTNTTSLDTLKAKLIEAQNSAKGLRTEFISAAQVNEMLASGAGNAFKAVTDSIGGAIRGVNTWKDVIGATGKAFMNFAADFLMQIGQMILKQAILNALQSSGNASGGFGGLIASAINAGVKHGGGVVGSGGAGRMVSPVLFANAPRYHGGGIAGLAPDEYPTILKKNEEVLTQSDPRNVLNGGGGSSQTVQTTKIINMIDSGSVVSEGLSSQQGERAIFNFIRANRTGLKQILG